MPIRYRSTNSAYDYTDYKHLRSKYNQSGFSNPSHDENVPTNFNLKEITLEDCDRGVYEEFNKRFRIANKWMPLIVLDAELVSIHYQNYEQYDTDKQYLNGPYFTIFRKKAVPTHRTNPAFKPAVYVVPKMKAQGIVFEEWITEGPLSYDLIYELKFISNFREYTNEMEHQMRHYFRNRRNIIIVNTERFSIAPTEIDTLAEVEIINRESVEQKTLYVSTYELKLQCWTRDLSNMQKRERPNTFRLDIETVDSLGKTQKDKTTMIDTNAAFNRTTNQPVIIDSYEQDTSNYPLHPSPTDTENLQALRNNVDNLFTESGGNLTDQSGNNIVLDGGRNVNVTNDPYASSPDNEDIEPGGDIVTQNG
jgi:hypothetical protein